MALSSRAVGVIGGSVLLALGLVVTMNSCGSADPALAGVWIGLAPVPKDAEDPLLARTLARIILTLKTDGSFRLVDGGLPLGGQWRRRDDRLTFEVRTLMDRPLALQPASARSTVGALSGRVEGGSVVFRGLAGTEVRLAREAAPAAAP